MAAMYAPIMDNIDILSWTFAVPYRLVYADWPSFLTGGVNGDLSGNLYELPTVNINYKSKTYTNRANETFTDIDYPALCGTGSLADYLNLCSPIFQNGTSASEENLQDLDKTDNISAIPFRVYHKIWNDYFRNQNIEPEEWDYIDGGNHDLSPVYARLRYKNFSKDYFTSALPDTQLGDPRLIPFEAEVTYVNRAQGDTIFAQNNTANDITVPRTAQIVAETGNNQEQVVPAHGGRTFIPKVVGDGNLTFSLDNSKNLRVINASATINNLREAIAIQEFQELNMRAGHRYIEFIMANFGVHSRDARLQRAEYLGGHLTPINISAVIQQSQSTQGNALGSYAGYGQAIGDVPGIDFYTADEHVMIMQIMCVVPHNSYMQGIPKYLDQRNRFDFPTPLLSGLGEQPIRNKEVFFDMYNADRQAYNEDTFGYTARYNEYRFIPDSIHGDFRQTLNSWHLARLFNSDDRPELNTEFIKIDPLDYNRIFNVTSDDFDHFFIEVYHTIDAFRCIPRLGIPKMSANPGNQII